MAKKILMHTLLVRTWDIEGYPDYFFGDDKKLYRFDSRGRVRQNKRAVAGGYTEGYYLRGEFISLLRLRPLLRRHREEEG